MAVPPFHFDPQTLDPANRADGVSAMLRVRDGAEFLQAGLESCLDIFDEVVAVHHQCSDATPQILHDLAERHPDRLKVYEYPHEVVPPHTPQHAKEGADSLNTIAALCNYTLSKTTRRIVIKHDADHIYIRPNLARAVAAMRHRCGGFVTASGVNLARSPDGALGVSLHDPFIAGVDCGFFPVSKDTYFSHNDRYETCHFGPVSRSPSDAGILFWHMKRLEKHCGLREYRWRYENNLDELHRRADAIRNRTEVLSLDAFIDRFGGVSGLLARRPVPHWLFRIRLLRPLAWHGVRLLNRAGVAGNLPLDLSLSYALERDLRGVSLPEAAAVR